MTETVFAFETTDHEYLRIDRNGTYTIGSQSDTSFQFDDSTVADIHAKLIKVGERILISPVDGDVSVNGTPVMHRQVDIQVGDEICIGSICLRLRRIDVTSTAFQQSAPPTSFETIDRSMWELDEPMQDRAPYPRPGRGNSNRKPTPPPAVKNKQPQPSSGSAQKPVPVQPAPPIQGAPPSGVTEKKKETGSPYLPASRQPTGNSSTQEQIQEPDNVFFKVYYPRQMPVENFAPFLVYAYVEDAEQQVEADVAGYAPQMGGAIPQPRQAKRQASIATGTPLTVTVVMDEDDIILTRHRATATIRTMGSDNMTGQSASITQIWNGDYSPYAFEINIPEPMQDEVVVFHVFISISGIEVARISNCSIEATNATVARTNPLLAAKQRVAKIQPLYQKIFISYSRRDTIVVEAYEQAQKALGNEVFRDTVSIRSGENWQAALAQAIDEADIFQLFWSENSAGSLNVRDEWEYALLTRCPDDSCVSFIRPVHWQNPLADVPDELSHLNFRYVELLKSDSSSSE